MNEEFQVSQERLDEITAKKIAKRDKVLGEYQLKGFVLKKVGEDIQPFLPGVVDGLVAEVISDSNVIIYKLDRNKGVKAIPYLQWRDGNVTERADKRGMNLEYVLPEGRSKGLFVSKTNKVLVPLLA